MYILLESTLHQVYLKYTSSILQVYIKYTDLVSQNLLQIYILQVYIWYPSSIIEVYSYFKYTLEVCFQYILKYILKVYFTLIRVAPIFPGIRFGTGLQIIQSLKRF